MVDLARALAGPLLILGVMSACSVEVPLADDAGDIVAPPRDAGADADAYCHYDCFRGYFCEDGVLTEVFHAPVPCSEWRGSCPRMEIGRCEFGCREWVSSGSDPADDLCADPPDHRPGDPCVTDEACRPTFATWDDDGNVTNTYLECVDGECVEMDAPVVEDWLAPCGSDITAIPVGAQAFVADPTCGEGVCLVLGSDECAAPRQGCSAPCAWDHECPAGAICAELESALGDPAARVCKPGPPGPAVGLTCPE